MFQFFFFFLTNGRPFNTGEKPLIGSQENQCGRANSMLPDARQLQPKTLEKLGLMNLEKVESCELEKNWNCDPRRYNEVWGLAPTPKRRNYRASQNWTEIGRNIRTEFVEYASFDCYAAEKWSQGVREPAFKTSWTCFRDFVHLFSRACFLDLANLF